ncbi:cyclic nucleotide-gated cation channel beta-1-like [Cheilinus undulatus]|uniref:cyclic nucleotide-gated cation channel beta-1-like n=1 Tax=Cheilinus undulatus TaxID=241271 RepID=UPI001BD34086|nr:cyclic nucleotide-gated cation channel beta-1-like [Cheilinus undulatus]
MLSWVAKIGPQLPEPPPKKIEVQKEEKSATTTATTTNTTTTATTTTTTTTTPGPKKVTFKDECTTEAPKPEKSKQEVQPEENSPAAGSQMSMLGWISSAFPQPAVSPKLSQTSSTPSKEENTTARKGMIAWIAQGLEKVVPQPDLKSKEPPPAEQPTEMCRKASLPAAEPQVTVKEAEQEDKTENKAYPPRMIDWIKQGIEKVVPQPEFHGCSNTDAKEKTETPPTAKAKGTEAPPALKPADAEKSSKEAELQPKMMDWIVNGIGRMLPQPVQKQDTVQDEVQKISIIQEKTDLVLEDMEQEMDAQQQEDKQIKETERLQENLQPMQEEREEMETNMDRCEPVINGTMKEADEEFLAHIEERLEQERLEAARVAEDMARKAAEEAVRQLEEERYAKFSIETPPESIEQLPNIVEENEDDPEGHLEVSAAKHAASPSSTEAEPASERRDQESPVSQPITEQPEQKSEEQTTTRDQDNASPEEEEEEVEGGCGAPHSCSPIQRFLLRFPQAAECLESCRKLLHQHNINPPKLSMPTPPPELSQLTQRLSQLPEQARQCFMSIASHFRNLNSKSSQPQEP